jgi:hypothetical protein
MAIGLSVDVICLEQFAALAEYMASAIANDQAFRW